MSEGVLPSLYGAQVASFLEDFFVAATAWLVVAVVGFLAVGWLGTRHGARGGAGL